MTLNDFKLQLQIDASCIEKVFHKQKLLLNALQPHNRSFSQPELHSDLINEYELFRRNFLCNDVNANIDKHNRCANMPNGYLKCDNCELDSDNSEQPPVPKPRKGVGKKKPNSSKMKVSSANVCDDVQLACDIHQAQ